ncbi:hypothetical protein [Psittacicella melopsittaci]|uniref:hypothetical protein n=1 Tax=Psittacicella melopsittaci TaxID=2028576 RepID=UPI001CA603B7|nr:hypothetical protein [Psittacicella melopsittaci]
MKLGNKKGSTFFNTNPYKRKVGKKQSKKKRKDKKEIQAKSNKNKKQNNQIVKNKIT